MEGGGEHPHFNWATKGGKTVVSKTGTVAVVVKESRGGYLVQRGVLTDH